MKGLLLKDFYTLKQYGKSMLFMLAFMALLSIGMDNSATFFQGMFTIFFMMMTISSFSYDNLAKWDHYALSLPVTRKTIVSSKYLLAIISCLLGTILSFFVAGIMLLIRPLKNFSASDHLLATGLILAVALFLVSILLPLIFKFGVEKSRIFLVAVFAIPFASIMFLDKLGVPMPSESAFITFVKFLPILAILILGASYLLSVRIYNVKEI